MNNCYRELRIFKVDIKRIVRNGMACLTDMAIDGSNDCHVNLDDRDMIDNSIGMINELLELLIPDCHQVPKLKEMFLQGNAPILLPNLMEEFQKCSDDNQPFCLHVVDGIFNKHVVVIDGKDCDW
tara:strand:+ start:799 stop:1173 length:375 start_codon:yes stop_codon:yes gene_type:complete